MTSANCAENWGGILFDYTEEQVYKTLALLAD